MSVDGRYSCETPAKTLKWIHAIIDFLKHYRFFLDAHVVNFFKDRLWEAVDKDWMDCLRSESVDTLLRIPSGCVQVYWPASLKKFILISRSLAISREQADLPKVFPDLPLVPLSNVLTQGMNGKKKHEIEALAAIVSSIAKQTQASTVVDVGAGQGYLAQVLSFEYQLSVTAIDACSHHGRTTDARAERIRKYYASKIRKSGSFARLEKKLLSMPKTVTCRVLSTDMLKALSCPVAQKGEEKIGDQINGHEAIHSCLEDRKSTLLLAGLHACGDLSVTMLRTFLECNEVKAVVSIGCCYNLLSEGDDNGDLHSGFPASKGVKCAGFVLGKSARDLACQSAERWANLGGAAGLHNFELHAFRAAFQMVLLRHYPETLMSSPTIGRQGKALRRQQNRKVLESSFRHESIDSTNIQSNGNCKKREDSLVVESSEAANEEGMHEVDIRDPAHEPCGTRGSVGSVSSGDGFLHGASCYKTDNSGEAKPVNNYPLFEKFCQSGLQRLDLHHSEELEFAGLWKETEPFTELIGPYWSLRAALGPVVETMLLLDRLLLIQEQDDILDARMVPIFDPVLSPRNIAVIARRS